MKYHAVEINDVIGSGDVARTFKVIAITNGDSQGGAVFVKDPDTGWSGLPRSSTFYFLSAILARSVCGVNDTKPATLDTLAFLRQHVTENDTVGELRKTEEAILRQVDEQGARLVDGAKDGGE
jgi:hypothetical protein